VAAATALAGCGDLFGPSIGAIEVRAVLSGSDPDPDGFTVTIDNRARALGVGGSVIYADLETGTYDVRLDGVASNCSVPSALQRAQVAEDDTTLVSFAVTCEPRQGSLEVSVATAGEDPDPDGYRVAVGDRTVAVGPNGTATFDGLDEGTVRAELLDIAGNCAVNGANPVTAEIGFGQTAVASFDVSCVPAVGAVEVEVATTGADPTGGYRASVAGSTLELPTDGSVVFTDVPTGEASVELLDVPGNCTLEGANPRSVEVAFGDTVEVEFFATCTSRLGAVEVDMTVIGNDVDRSFLLAVAADTFEIGWTETRVFPDIPEGPTTLELLDVANNCTLEGANPRVVDVVWQDTVRAEFSLRCELRAGTVEVTTITTGDDPDADGYSVAVDGSTTPIGLDETLFFGPIVEGSVTVGLEDVAPNCTVAGENPRTLSITYPDTVPATFEVQCLGQVGTVEVDVSTAGEDVDIDGYQVAVGDDTVDVAVNGSAVIEGVPEGEASVALLDVAGNCTVQEANPAPVTVPFQGTAGVDFTVACQLGRLAYVSDRDDDLDIYTMDADGGNRQRVTGNQDVDTRPSWSPDGQRLVFYSDRDENDEVFTIPAGGGTAINITNHDDADYLPSWTPDDRILFTSRRAGNAEVYIADPDGSNLQRLTRNDAFDGYAVASPDGSQIAFSSDRDGGFEIYIMELPGRSIRQLTGGAGDKFFPAWSPDGTQIVYTSYETGGGDLYMKAADGGTPPVRLTDDPADDATPSWSPGGTRIAFASRRDGDYEIYIMDPDGSNIVKITNSSGFDVFPAWKP
jgi:Tol biopolymer transport system component